MSLSTSIKALLTVITQELGNLYVAKKPGKDLSDVNFTKALKDKLDKLKPLELPKDSYFLSKSEKDKIKSDAITYILVQGDSGIKQVSVGIYKKKTSKFPENQVSFVL